MSDSESEPINYQKKSFGYDANKPAAIIAGVTFAFVTAVLFIRLYRRKTWWGLCLPIGTAAFSSGFFLRLLSAQKPTNFPIYVVKEILLLTSPAAFLAFNYIVYGRFIATCSNDRDRYSLLRPAIVAKFFIISDIVTFLVQAGGGGLRAEEETKSIGRVVMIIGIVVQSVSYVVFYVLLVHSHCAFRNDGKFDAYNFPWRLFHILHFSSICIIIRSTYRVIEVVEGTDGYLRSHEVFFYVLDTIPLLFGTVIYTYWWPAKMIGGLAYRGGSSITLRPMDRMDP